MSNKDLGVFWARQDLRLQDNQALQKASSHGALLVVYISDAECPESAIGGAAAKWFLHSLLKDFDDQLKGLGQTLYLEASTQPAKSIAAIAKRFGAKAVYWNECYDPRSKKDSEIARDALRNLGISCDVYHSNLLLAPADNLKSDGTPYRVFTPFWKSLSGQIQEIYLSQVRSLPPAPKDPKKKPKLTTRQDLKLLPTHPWADKLTSTWTPTYSEALKLLDGFDQSQQQSYPSNRDLPAIEGTSRLSPYLHFGTLSPKRIWQAVCQSSGSYGTSQPFLRQLAWRDFANHLLSHFPYTLSEPMNPTFKKFPWQVKTSADLVAWQQGKTGYPFVDAGMRQLWSTGWMHNRVRMVVASFLVKHLLVHWQKGAEWFWDTLVDADLANNTMGWQWVAGCGVDASPFFRIFNPITQGQKFDPDGHYIRQFCPELKNLSNKDIHTPWLVDPVVLKKSGIELGADYPPPIVDHKAARESALAAYKLIRS